MRSTERPSSFCITVGQHCNTDTERRAGLSAIAAEPRIPFVIFMAFMLLYDELPIVCSA